MKMGKVPDTRRPHTSDRESNSVDQIFKEGMNIVSSTNHMRSRNLSIYKTIGILVLISGLLAGVANLIHPKRIPWVQDWRNYVETKALESGIDTIPLSVAYALYRDGLHVFVDARPPQEFSTGHIPKAISLPFETLDERFDMLELMLDSESPSVVYCKNRECDDALLLAVELRELGKTNLLYYVDGFEIWKESGCPIETN